VHAFLVAVLSVVVGLYFVAVSIAAIGLFTRRRDAQPQPSSWPHVSVVVAHTPPNDRFEECLERLQHQNYPTDRYEIILTGAAANELGAQEANRHSTGSPPVRLATRGGTTSSVERTADPPHVHRIAEGDVYLYTRAQCLPGSDWIRTMAAHCTSETPFVVGPVLVEHENLFLPRLQALEQIGRLSFQAGAGAVNLPLAYDNRNVALYGDRMETNTEEAEPDPSPRTGLPIRTAASVELETVLLDPNAQVRIPPRDSVWGDLVCRARELHASVRSSSLPTSLWMGHVWFTHVVLMLSALIAVSMPPWRQPVLLAIVAKMGADVLLTFPVARRLDERGLLRSVVPTELFLIFVLPLAASLGILRAAERTDSGSS